MKISVVIPAFNEEKYLLRTLNTIQSQSVLPYEIIVVDNNSTDQTARIAKKAGARVVHETKKGYVHAVHRGLNEASGDVIALTDSDTQLPLHWFERVMGHFQDEEIAAAGGSLSYQDAGVIGNFLTYPSYTVFMQLHFWIGKPHLTGSTMAIRRSVLEKIGGINTAFEIGADVDLGMRAKAHGRVIFDPKLTVITSSRRWHANRRKQLITYTGAYLNAVWLRRPVKGGLQVIR